MARPWDKVQAQEVGGLLGLPTFHPFSSVLRVWVQPPLLIVPGETSAQEGGWGAAFLKPVCLPLGTGQAPDIPGRMVPLPSDPKLTVFSQVPQETTFQTNWEEIKCFVFK